jgi:toxin ParE1/3/4
MNVIISERAFEDLLEIGAVIAEHNPLRARTFVNELRLACRSLGGMPHAHPLLDRYEQAGMRKKPFGNYLIFYRVSDHVEVISVLHAARDYERLLFPQSGDTM